MSLGLDDTTPTRVALTLRVLRLARVSFYMKLINTPLLQELANIVQGFLVAARATELLRNAEMPLKC